jgi:hypothetical protein
MRWQRKLIIPQLSAAARLTESHLVGSQGVLASRIPTL